VIPASRELGLRVQRARQDKGLEQIPFARMIGVSPRTLGKIEQGVRGILDDHELATVAAALGVSAVWLTSGDASTPKAKGLSVDDLVTGLPTDHVRALMSACRRELARRR
jgi:transcriptional regulator with XRE-family HTH domain